jgi:hypothetical protein
MFRRLIQVPSESIYCAKVSCGRPVHLLQAQGNHHTVGAAGTGPEYGVPRSKIAKAGGLHSQGAKGEAVVRLLRALGNTGYGVLLIVAKAGGLHSQGVQGRSRSHPTASPWQHRIWSPPAFATSGPSAVALVVNAPPQTTRERPSQQGGDTQGQGQRNTRRYGPIYRQQVGPRHGKQYAP